ncbi:MAG: glycosyltransferase family 4 protein [Cytophagales bacterium]|nr:glycosyltransferase family 4 protein [Cytophagales bacterium]
MRIAIVINTSWNIYNFRMGIVRSLLDKNNEVIAITPRDKYTEKLIKQGCEYYPIKIDNKGVNLFNDILLIFELYKAYKKVKPKIILHYTIKPNIYGTLAAKLLKIPVINNVSGLGTVFIRENIVSIIAKILYKLTFRFSKKVFFQNKDDLQLFLKNKLVKREITDIIPGSGVDIDKFKYHKFKRNTIFTFLLISRLLYDKGIVEYIEAIKIFKHRKINAKFQLLGLLDCSNNLGISKELLDSWIKNKLIDYLGFTDDVIQFIKKADCIVLPSYREGIPKTLLEAASMGKPLIATNVPGCREVVESGINGYLCEVKNANDLSEKMNAMASLKNDSLKMMGVKSRDLVTKMFDERIVVEKYIKAVEN